MKALEKAQAPPDDGNIIISDFIKKTQHEMARKFQYQKTKGGIIDVEEEKNKFLITEVVYDAEFQIC